MASLLSVTMLVAHGSTAPRSRSAIWTLAPVDVLAAGGFARLAGIAAGGDGSLLVVDAGRRTLTRIDPSGRRVLLAERLQRPVGVAVAPDGATFLIEAAGHRVVRFQEDGSVAPVVSGLKQPAALAAGPDGRLWLAARDRNGPHDVIAQIDSSGELTPVAGALRRIRALAAEADELYAGTAGAVARFSLLPDGAGAAPRRIVGVPFKTIFGIGLDVAGSLFVSGTVRTNGVESGVIARRVRTGDMTYLATGVTVFSLAFMPGGDLAAIDRHDSRILRFRAPQPPEVSIPAFTNDNPLAVAGSAGAGELVQVFADRNRRQPPVAEGVANRVTGRFALPVRIAEDAATELYVAATGAGGAGLASGVRVAGVVHDGRLPDVSLLEPAPGVHARAEVPVRAVATDEGSGPASITLAVDDLVVGGAQGGGANTSRLVAAAVVDTRDFAEGTHALIATATDRAGNVRSEAQPVIVDRTPPETRIVGGPEPDGSASARVFVVDGMDALSPVLEFSWRVDTGPWSMYANGGRISVDGLAAGTHTFEVRARDLAGNEDPSPASQVVSAEPVGIRIVEPAPGAAMTGGVLWVRGTVTGPEPVSVAVRVPAGLRAAYPFESIPGAAIAGTFVVELPVIPGLTVIPVTATDARGNTATATIDVTPPGAEPPGGSIALSPDAGFAPRAVRIGLQGLPPGSYDVDLESDGIVDYSGPDVDGREFTYTRPGVYLASVIGVANGQPYAWRAPVQVFDRGDLERQLQAAWIGFREALGRGDIDGAVAFIHGSRRATWRDMFREVPPASLASAGTVFTDIALVEVSAGRIECEMMREAGGLMYSYPVSFAPDADGQWRLWQF